ncbi:MAG: hypothetical protein ACREBG_05285 [Pyrinomonadaceae bacterium]
MPQTNKKRTKPKPPNKRASGMMMSSIREEFFHLPAKGGRNPVKVPKAAKKR